jgi:hypothetical protein
MKLFTILVILVSLVAANNIALIVVAYWLGKARGELKKLNQNP